ncbi:MAG: sensor histidine kinase [Chloroflexota bacterium]
MSLRLRLTLTYSALVAIVIVAFGGFLYVSMWETLNSEMDRRLQVRADEVQLALWPEPHSPTLGDLSPSKLDLSPLADLNAPGLYVQVLNLSGTVIATSDSLKGITLPTDSANFSQVRGGKSVFSDVTVPGYPSIRVLSVPITVKDTVAGILQVSQSRRPLQETMAGLGTLSLVLGIVGLALSALAGWIVAQRGLRPLNAMALQASDVADRRDFGQRLRSPERHDEVGRLAQTINGLLATVDDTLHTHREFVADTSHELRNPLLALQTNLDLLDRIPDQEGRDECLREARQQAERMSRLVKDLLLLAQVEAGLVIEQRPVDLAGVVERVEHEITPRLRGQHLRVEKPDQPVIVLGDEGRLAQVLSNLLDNALKHTPAGGHIDIRLTDSGGQANIAVTDTGDGIGPEHLPRIFDRAYRVPGTRGGGLGFGLSIVKHLTEAHGGRVSAESQPGRGSRFSVSLPARQQGAAPPARLSTDLVGSAG